MGCIPLSDTPEILWTWIALDKELGILVSENAPNLTFHGTWDKWKYFWNWFNHLYLWQEKTNQLVWDVGLLHLIYDYFDNGTASFWFLVVGQNSCHFIDPPHFPNFFWTCKIVAPFETMWGHIFFISTQVSF